MSFSASGVFVQWPLAMVNKSATGYGGVTSDTIKAALYNDTGTPSKTAAVGLTGYAAATSAWVTGNEQTDTNWAAGGRTITTVTSTVSSNVYKMTGDNTAGGGNVTLSGVKGCLVYDDTISGGTVQDQGICFNYFGGAQSVTAGTFTIVWNASGIMTITV